MADPQSPTVDSPPTPIRRHHPDPAAADPLNPTEETPLLLPSNNRLSYPHNLSIPPELAAGPPLSQIRESYTPESVESKSVWYLILLTVCIGGLQVAWSVELSNGSSYFLSLGLSKSVMALVWIAGPLTGTLVQPYIGMLSDNCRSSWGKRKPFMVFGTLATVISLIVLSRAKEIIGALIDLFNIDVTEATAQVIVITVAVAFVYILDMAINTVQASIRAFIVDNAPPHQQEAANAMASRMTGLGNIVGYLAGYVELHQYLPWLAGSQFQALCAVASVLLVATIVVSTSSITEKVASDANGKKVSLAGFFGQLGKSIKRLPVQIKRVCYVQLFSWIGWFPFLFYTSSYIGDLYVQPFLKENPDMSPGDLEKLYEEATRIGTFALFINTVVMLATNILLPFFIAPTYDRAPVGAPAPTTRSFFDLLRIPGLTLKRAWFISLLFFAGTLFATIFIKSVQVATILVGSIGFTWALTLWAPWAIISAEISRRDALLRIRRVKQQELATRWFPFRTPLGLGTFDDGRNSELGCDEESQHDDAGVILGIHNMSISAPQIIANIGSSVIFYFFQKPRGTPGDHSMSYVFALGALFVLIAATFVYRIDDQLLEERALIDSDEEETNGLLTDEIGDGLSEGGAGLDGAGKDWWEGKVPRGAVSGQSSVHEHEGDEEEGEWYPEMEVGGPAELEGEMSGAGPIEVVEEPDKRSEEGEIKGSSSAQSTVETVLPYEGPRAQEDSAALVTQK